jgi:hypothetical protein
MRLAWLALITFVLFVLQHPGRYAGPAQPGDRVGRRRRHDGRDPVLGAEDGGNQGTPPSARCGPDLRQRGSHPHPAEREERMTIAAPEQKLSIGTKLIYGIDELANAVQGART